MLRSWKVVALLSVVMAGILLAGMRVQGQVVVNVAGEDGEPWLGVYLQELSDAMRQALNIEDDVGVLVTEVAEDSPAEKAGLEVGDVIVEFDGRTIEDADDLRRAVRRTDPGEKVDVVVVREGKRRTITAEIGERPHPRRRVYGRSWEGLRPFVFAIGGRAFLGVELAELNPDLAEYFKVEEGALVLEVEENSPAEKAGMHAGDVIVAIDGEQVRDPEDVFEILKDFEEGDKAEVEVVRHGKRQKLSVELEEARRRLPRGLGLRGLPEFFYFYRIPGDREGHGWEWDWDWDRGWPGGREFIRIWPGWDRHDEVNQKLNDAGRRLQRAMIRVRSVL